MSTVLTVLLIIVSVLLITVIILQPGKSAGLSGAISGGAEQLFGKQKSKRTRTYSTSYNHRSIRCFLRNTNCTGILCTVTRC